MTDARPGFQHPLAPDQDINHLLILLLQVMISVGHEGQFAYLRFKSLRQFGLVGAQMGFGVLENFALAMQKGLKLRLEQIHINRLMQKTVKASGQGAFSRANAEIGCDSHDWRVWRQNTAQANGHIVAGHPGQIDIEQNKIRAGIFRQIYPTNRIPRIDNVIPPGKQTGQ